MDDHDGTAASNRRELSKYINLTGGKVCLNVNLVQLSASNGHVLQSKTKVNMIVCDRSLMKQVLTLFDQWRQQLRDSLYAEQVYE